MDFLNIDCKECGKTFPRKLKKVKDNNFCCQKCYYSWLRKNARPFPSTKGVLNPKYLHDIDHHAICQWCKTIFETSGYKARTKKAIFCSKECRRNWYANVWSQTNEWKETSKIRAIKILSDNKISKTHSGIQIIVNNMLNKCNILYENEKPFLYFSVDNYLIDSNLVIENMGTYWHCDHRKYDEIVYESQVNRIKKDKAKRTFIRNNFGIEPLYLWEYDINNNAFICEELIKLYAISNGVLANYHSFNYEFIEGKISIKASLEIPFMDFEIEDLNKIIDIKIKQKTSKKQIHKWIIYSCDFCGKEKEELISHYNQKERHFCNQECFHEYRKNNDWHRRTPLLAKKLIE